MQLFLVQISTSGDAFWKTPKRYRRVYTPYSLCVCSRKLVFARFRKWPLKIRVKRLV